MAILASNQYTIIDYTDVYIDVSPGSILIPVDTENKALENGNKVITIFLKNGGGEILTSTTSNTTIVINGNRILTNNNNSWNYTYSWLKNASINSSSLTINATYKTYENLSISIPIMPIAQGEDGLTINTITELYYFRTKPADITGWNEDELNSNEMPSTSTVGENKLWQESPYGVWEANAAYWTCSQITYNNGSIAYTNPIRAENFNVSYEAKADVASKIKTYYSDDAPTNVNEGDLWYDSNDGNKMYRWTKKSNNEYEWQEVSDSRLNNLIDDSDGEVTIYYQREDDDPTISNPNNINENDLWCDFSKDTMRYVWHKKDNSDDIYSEFENNEWIEIEDEDIIETLGTLLTKLEGLQVNNSSDGN